MTEHKPDPTQAQISLLRDEWEERLTKLHPTCANCRHARWTWTDEDGEVYTYGHTSEDGREVRHGVCEGFEGAQMLLLKGGETIHEDDAACQMYQAKETECQSTR